MILRLTSARDGSPLRVWFGPRMYWEEQRSVEGDFECTRIFMGNFGMVVASVTERLEEIDRMMEQAWVMPWPPR